MARVRVWVKFKVGMGVRVGVGVKFEVGMRGGCGPPLFSNPTRAGAKGSPKL